MKLREKATVIDMALMQAEAQLKAADELAAAVRAWRVKILNLLPTPTAAVCDVIMKLDAYLRLREPGKAQPADSPNQCDGCQAGRPLDENGNHRMGDGDYPDLMRCQCSRYPQPAIPQGEGARESLQAFVKRLPEHLKAIRDSERITAADLAITFGPIPEGAQEPATCTFPIDDPDWDGPCLDRLIPGTDRCAAHPRGEKA